MKHERRPRELRTAELARELAAEAQRIHQTEYQLLRAVGEFDAQGGFAGDGFKSCAHWLSSRCEFALAEAAERVRVARALRVLPLVSDAMQRGVLSFDMVQLLTRIATPESESALLTTALGKTVSQLEKLVQPADPEARIQEVD